MEAKKLHPNYVKIKKINGGAYGKIYIAERVKYLPIKGIFPWQDVEPIEEDDNRLVAIKKFKPMKNKEGMDVDTVREIKFLQSLRHPNIISLELIFLKPCKKKLEENYKAVCFVMDYMISLRDLLADVTLDLIPHCNYLMSQLMEGIAYLHENMILHRDLKPENILINRQGVLQIVDFGLSRNWKQHMTQQVCTVNYRAPELFFGSDQYGPSADIWSCGCIFAEIHLRRPIFQGMNGRQVLDEIMNILGTPTEENWPGYTQLPQVFEFEPRLQLPFNLLLPKLQSHDLLKSMLKYGISLSNYLGTRYSAKEVLSNMKPQQTPSQEFLKILEVIWKKKTKI